MGELSDPKSEKAVLEWPWKFYLPGTGRRGPREPELYDLASSPLEKSNVAAQHADVVKKLSADLAAWDATLPKTYVKAVDKAD